MISLLGIVVIPAIAYLASSHRQQARLLKFWYRFVKGIYLMFNRMLLILLVGLVTNSSSAATPLVLVKVVVVTMFESGSAPAMPAISQ